ncbi:MAG TPA: hypothetical protein VIY48_02065 [Candidatus Paceibacterota bacterium]
MTSPTPNKGYTYPAHGGAVNSWDSPLNADFDQIDLNVGGTYPITMGSSFAVATYNSSGATIPSTAGTITLPSSLAQNMNYPVTGTIAANTNLVFPSAGGFYFVTNNSSGAFTLTAKTGAGTGVLINQGGGNSLVNDGTNINYGNSNQGKAQLYTYLGNPNTNVAGVVASVNGGVTDAVWDQTDQQLYVATTQGTAATTVWTPQLARLVPEGYLTVSTDPNNPIISADTTGTVINYYPYVGNWTLLSNGTVTYPYQFSAMSLYLSASQAANQIYDVFQYANPTAGVISPVIGTGPAWTTATAGACSRGTGAGTTQLSRFQGVWTNAVSMNLTTNPTNAGNVTLVVPANQAIYIGTIHVDATAGQVTCHRTSGQNRKFGVWNPYNKQRIYLKVNDSLGSGSLASPSWTYAGATYRAADNAPITYSNAAFNVGSGTTCNGMVLLQGLAEDPYDITYQDVVTNSAGGSATNIGIGINSISSPSGTIGTHNSPTIVTGFTTVVARYNNLASTFTGITNVCAVEVCPIGGTSWFLGSELYQNLTASWRG